MTKGIGYINSIKGKVWALCKFDGLSVVGILGLWSTGSVAGLEDAALRGESVSTVLQGSYYDFRCYLYATD